MWFAFREDMGYHVRLTPNSCGGAAYRTSGGNIWTVQLGAPIATLAYCGSRWGFMNGCNAVRVEQVAGKVFAVACNSRNNPPPQGEIHLLEWWSTLPGNPDPFEDWIAIKDAENAISAYADQGEAIESRYHGWKLAA